MDPNLVICEIRDDGSQKSCQEEVARQAEGHSNITLKLFEQNKGVMGMLAEGLNESTEPYTYIGASDDLVSGSIINKVLSDLSHKESPVIVSNFYTIEEPSKTSVFSEAIIPIESMTGSIISGEDFLKQVNAAQLPTYLASHALLCPTEPQKNAGGYLTELKWHCDWFLFTVAAVRSPIKFVKLPIGCWRHAPDTLSSTGSRDVNGEIKLLQDILETLLKPEFKDVRDKVMSPKTGPFVQNTGFLMLQAMLKSPRFWSFLRFGHFKRAFVETFSPRFYPMLMNWTANLSNQGIRSFFMRLLLKMNGARIGRRVVFGRNNVIIEPKALTLLSDVVLEDNVFIHACYPIKIGKSVRVGNGARIESENMSPKSAIPFIRRKSIHIGHHCVIGEGSHLGPGSFVPEGRHLPAGSVLDDVEAEPLYYLNEQNQICINENVLHGYYGLEG